jgi:hypothetical protein
LLLQAKVNSDKCTIALAIVLRRTLSP